jgi:hypothetical protein
LKHESSTGSTLTASSSPPSSSSLCLLKESEGFDVLKVFLQLIDGRWAHQACVHGIAELSVHSVEDLLRPVLTALVNNDNQQSSFVSGKSAGPIGNDAEISAASVLAQVPVNSSTKRDRKSQLQSASAWLESRSQRHLLVADHLFLDRARSEKKNSCKICNLSGKDAGAIVFCSESSPSECFQTMHVSCAIRAGFHVIEDQGHGCGGEFKIFCKKHSLPRQAQLLASKEAKRMSKSSAPTRIEDTGDVLPSLRKGRASSLRAAYR